MTVETFFANFGHLADAPNGVQKLRELILQLAVQGKLVEQDSEDEPASVLLERIKAEKERLVKEKKIRSSKPLPPIAMGEGGQQLPLGWHFVRIGELGETQTGTTPSRSNKENVGDHIPFIGPGDIRNHQIDYSGQGLSETGLANGRLIEEGSVMMVCIGGSIGKHAINDRDVSCNQQINTITPYLRDSVRYLFLAMGTEWFQRMVINESTGSATPIVNKQKWSSIPIPVPPEAEQKRIVAKVDQLMALCDELEARQQKQQQGRVRLNNAALDALLTAREPDEFADHWQRISTNFDLLYDQPETIAKLRAAILQLAVQGKLVDQDSNDEPASVLLERIKAEKERLVTEGRFRKSKPSLSVSSEEEPYQVPRGWLWTKLDALADIGTGTTPSKTNPLYYSNGSVPWVTSSATADDIVRDAETHVTELAVKECRLRKYQPGTLVIALYGQGKTRGQVTELGIEATVNQACSTIDVGDGFAELKAYIRILLEKQYDEIRELAAGGAQPNLNVGKIKDILVPLPPQNEQKRIVAKVDQLMAMCDELETKLNQAQQHSEKLMEATVRQLLVA